MAIIYESLFTLNEWYTKAIKHKDEYDTNHSVLKSCSFGSYIAYPHLKTSDTKIANFKK